MTKKQTKSEQYTLGWVNLMLDIERKIWKIAVLWCETIIWLLQISWNRQIFQIKFAVELFFIDSYL